MLCSSEGLTGSEEEISGNCIGFGGKLNKDVSERVDVSETSGTGNRLRKEKELKEQHDRKHERFQPHDPRPTGMMGNKSERKKLLLVE